MPYILVKYNIRYFYTLVSIAKANADPDLLNFLGARLHSGHGDTAMWPYRIPDTVTAVLDKLETRGYNVVTTTGCSYDGDDVPSGTVVWTLHKRDAPPSYADPPSARPPVNYNSTKPSTDPNSYPTKDKLPK